MGDSTLVAPVLFLKPPSAAVAVKAGENRVAVKLPRGRGSVHYETEIVLHLGPDASTFDAATLGLDLTLRDVQAAARAKGSPWETAKVWPGSAVLGPWLDLKSMGDYLDAEFTFELNGKTVQRGVGRDMVSCPATALEAAATTVGVAPGDLFFTGTPAGVGPLAPGDVGVLKWGDRLAVEVAFE